ncbi:hypothetical protein EWI61_01755 [Methylolobus aquaticus]|nr:hypothetical protein EWI61_01755 [Methylolobus aquaticus]
MSLRTPGWTARPGAAVLLSLAAALLLGCAGDGKTLTQELDPDADQRITRQDEVAVEVVAVAGLDTGALDLRRLAKNLRDRIDRRKATIPSPRPARRFDLSLTITRYDGGQAAGAAGFGQTHIDGWRLLTNPDIIARAHRYRDRVVDRQTFDWGRAYATPTPVETVEGDFADAVASDLFDAQ